MKLSNNLLLSEALVTQTGLDNAPSPEHLEKLFMMAQFQFQPTRDKWGKILVTSGYRTPEVNAHPTVRGSRTSQHLLAEAFDTRPLQAEINTVFHWMVRNLTFGQLILGHDGNKHWIHCSMPRLNRDNMAVLIFDGRSYKPYTG